MKDNQKQDDQAVLDIACNEQIADSAPSGAQNLRIS